MIYELSPKNWRDLQNKVAEILTECGFDAEVEFHPDSVRSDIEIDVFACEKIGNRENVFIIECKNWNHKIPQTVVHSVRTVIQDIGGNTGYIISKKGFQSGAYEAAKFTNVKLLTWNEFQDLFEEQWREKFLDGYIENNWKRIIDYSEPLFWPKWASELSESKKDELRKILYKMDKLGMLLLRLKTSKFFNKEQVHLPLNQYEYFKNYPSDLLDIQGYKELITKLHVYCDSVLNEYDEYKNKTINEIKKS